MLKSKWDTDKEAGKGFRIEQTQDLFSNTFFTNYPELLKIYIKSSDTGYRTNHELFDFGLENNYLPMHTNEVLNEWSKQGLVHKISIDKKDIKGNYLENKKRTIGFKFNK